MVSLVEEEVSDEIPRGCTVIHGWMKFSNCWRGVGKSKNLEI